MSSHFPATNPCQVTFPYNVFWASMTHSSSSLWSLIPLWLQGGDIKNRKWVNERVTYWIVRASCSPPPPPPRPSFRREKWAPCSAARRCAWCSSSSSPARPTTASVSWESWAWWSSEMWVLDCVFDPRSSSPLCVDLCTHKFAFIQNKGGGL